MTDQRLMQIREAIAVAKVAEKSTSSLRSYLTQILPALHRTITLPENGEDVLFEFVSRYIEHAPNFIGALHAMTDEAGIHGFAKPFLTIIEDYFLRPPDLVDQHSGLRALIDEAYLAHRLIEEVNDRVVMVCGLPLAPMDMTISNIIIHGILGEEFANELDLAVHYTIETKFNASELNQNTAFNDYITQRKENGWKQTLIKWPCLAGDSEITLNLEHIGNAALHH